jgi:hypothetical protein
MRAYLSHPIRGIKGAAATEADMVANNKRAMEFADSIRRSLPDLDLYVPAEHDEFVIIANQLGYISEHEILQVDCNIVRRCDVVLVYDWDALLSKGMLTEIHSAREHGIPVVYTRGELSPIFRHCTACRKDSTR